MLPHFASQTPVMCTCSSHEEIWMSEVIKNADVLPGGSAFCNESFPNLIMLSLWSYMYRLIQLVKFSRQCYDAAPAWQRHWSYIQKQSQFCCTSKNKSRCISWVDRITYAGRVLIFLSLHVSVCPFVACLAQEGRLALHNAPSVPAMPRLSSQPFVFPSN